MPKDLAYEADGPIDDVDEGKDYYITIDQTTPSNLQDGAACNSNPSIRRQQRGIQFGVDLTNNTNINVTGPCGFAVSFGTESSTEIDGVVVFTKSNITAYDFEE